MRRLILTGLLVLISAPTIARASVPGARFHFVAPGPRHTFTLTHARELVVREQRREGFPLHDLDCFWVKVHRAGCEGTWTGTVLTGGQPERLLLVDWVTRAGGCSTPVVKRTGPDSGIAHGGGGHPHDCFTGPLVVEVGPTTLD